MKIKTILFWIHLWMTKIVLYFYDRHTTIQCNCFVSLDKSIRGSLRHFNFTAANLKLILLFFRACPELWVLQECWCQASLYLRLSYTSCKSLQRSRSPSPLSRLWRPLNFVVSVATLRPFWSLQTDSWLSMRSTTGLHESLPISGETQPHGR